MSKQYKLNLTYSNGRTLEAATFTIPKAAGRYRLNFTLSNGTVLTAGHIEVGSAANKYRLTLTLSNGTTINCGTLTTEALVTTIMRFLIGGNQKMNLTEADVSTYVNALSFTNDNSTIVLFPQTCLIKSFHDAIEAKGLSIKLGAQLCSPYEKGAFTGQNSVAALMSVGAEYFMVGNDEVENYMGSGANVEYAGQIAQIIANGGNVVFFINESQEDFEAGNWQTVLSQRIETLSLAGISQDSASKVTLVYMPTWAIGTGLTCSATDAAEKIASIYQAVSDRFGISGFADSFTYTYGGSSKPSNITEILNTIVLPSNNTTVGAITGGVSLKPAQFSEFLTVVGNI